MLRDIHNKGADLYNASDPVGCYRMFQGGLEVARALLAHRPAEQRAIEDGIAAAEVQASMAKRAFALHELIEKVRTRLRPASSEPIAIPPREKLPGDSPKDKPKIPVDPPKDKPQDPPPIDLPKDKPKDKPKDPPPIDLPKDKPKDPPPIDLPKLPVDPPKDKPKEKPIDAPKDKPKDPVEPPKPKGELLKVAPREKP